MEEMTSRLPVTESPLWKRITAGVYSVGRIRRARQANDGGGPVICLTDSIVLALQCIGDYERVYKDEVTQLPVVRNRKRESLNIHLFGSAPGASFGLEDHPHKWVSEGIRICARCSFMGPELWCYALKREGSYLGQWMKGLEGRASRNVVIVATANKLARISWAVLSSGENYHPMPAVALAS